MDNINELAAELIGRFLANNGISDKQLIDVLKRMDRHTGVPAPGTEVLIRYRTKSGEIRWAVSKWTGNYWGGNKTPECWYYLPEE